MALKFTKLTRPAIRQLRPGESITEHGIVADCLPNGDIRYTVNIMADGERIHRVVGRESENVTRTQAEEFVAKLRTDAREGRLSLPKKRKTHLTFRAAAKLYLDKQEKIGAKSLGPKERHIRLHLVPYFKDMRLDRISDFTLGTFKKDRLAAGLSVATVNRILATYRHMAGRLLAWKDITRPLPAVSLEEEDNARDYVITTGDESGLLTAALADVNTYIWLFIKAGLGTSLRHSEILAFRFDLFDYARRRIRVKVKGGSWRNQPMTQELANIIQREREMAEDQDGWVFPSKITKSGHIESMSKAFERCVTEAKLDPARVSPHTLRHTAITRFADSEPRPTLPMIRAFSGHKSLKALSRYLHATDKDVDKALDSMSGGGTSEERETLIRLEKS